MQNFYQLLSLDVGAPPEDIKRAFRAEIARYHPDKVHHLGKEFQEMAATRAAQLTEAYRILMNAELRAEYDLTLSGGVEAAPAAPPPSPSSARPAASPAPATGRPRNTAAAAAPPPTSSPIDSPSRFSFERTTRDEFVRKAIIGKVRQGIEAELGAIEDAPARGLDLSCFVKAKKLFARAASRRFVARYVPHVDKAAVRDTWSLAQKLDEHGDVCVFLVGNSMAPSKELGDAIADERKRRAKGCRVYLVPVDVRDWSALVPSDAPASCKAILTRIRNSSSV